MEIDGDRIEKRIAAAEIVRILEREVIISLVLLFACLLSLVPISIFRYLFVFVIVAVLLIKVRSAYVKKKGLQEKYGLPKSTLDNMAESFKQQENPDEWKINK